MPDPGFSWHELHVKESVSRLLAACLMEESGRLLEAASLLWPGRVRAKDILTLGVQFEDQGQGWRHNAVCLADHPWGTGLDMFKTAGHLLGDFRFSGRYHKPKMIPEKNRGAAKVLIRAAFHLAYSAVPLIRNSGGIYRDKEANSLEDTLEIAEEAPFAVGSENAINAEFASSSLGPRSISLFNAGLAASVSTAYLYQNGILREPRSKERKETIDRWSAISKGWRAQAESNFEKFAIGAGMQAKDFKLTERLIGASGTANDYIPYSRDHYTDDETMQRVEAVARALSAALWKLTGHESGIDLCDLDSPPKPTPQIG